MADNIFSKFPTGQASFKEFYKDHFDTIFLALNPFFKISNGVRYDEPWPDNSTEGYRFIFTEHSTGKKTEIKAPDIALFNYHPKPEEMQQVSWKEISRLSGLSFQEIEKALGTLAGDHYVAFARPDLMEKLDNVLYEHHVWPAWNSSFNALTLAEVYNGLQAVKAENIMTTYGNDRQELDIRNISLEQFQGYAGNLQYIYTADKKLLFTTYFELPWYLICSDKTTVEKVVSGGNIEGFYCDEQTNSTWPWEKEEFQRLRMEFKKHR